MKKFAILLCLLAASCEPPSSGQIIGKRMWIREGYFTDTTLYYIKFQDEQGRTGEAQVTKEMWERASNKMTWPFGDK